MKIPFLNLKPQHDLLRNEINAAIQEVIDTSSFAGGPFVTSFEEDFAKYCQSRFAIGLGSGTEALWLALLARGVGPGDEVITVPSTFMATAEAITYCGATPVFVDINEKTYTLDPDLLERAITKKTKAVIPVHLFGQMADMAPIMAIAAKHHLFVVEDACQAHGAEYRGKVAGSIGDSGCFSFYPGKNLGAMGEAGAVTTNDSDLRQKIQTFRDHGQVRKYHHSVVGWNARMDGIQGAILQIKLKHLANANELRRTHAKRYDDLLRDVPGVIIPHRAEYGVPVYHLYAIRVKKRDEILQELTKRGIGCGIHYPIPVHLQEAYRSLGLAKGSFPVAEKCADEFLSLPMFPELTPEQIETVVSELCAVLPGKEVQYDSVR